MKRLVPIAIIVAVLIIAVGGVYMLLKSPEPTNISQLPPQTPAAPAPTVVPEDEPVHFKGRMDAPVRLEEYGDYQCPPCGLFHPIAQRVLSSYGDRVRFSFRNLPLPNIHKHAQEAARAAEAAGQQGKFWEMHDLLYERQQEWSKADVARPLFLRYAQELGLNMSRFTQDLDGAVTGMRVAQDAALAQMRGVTGTPTVFLNGRMLSFEETMDFDKLRVQIDAALAGKS
ncbi:MAG TPA: thioredoxin domain-containing protein [Pyrinomonadaceae bacterium]|jgi:protein-disulfide isomerase